LTRIGVDLRPDGPDVSRTRAWIADVAALLVVARAVLA
jgi:hypothetical protein